MLESHQWLTPTNDGIPRLQKPLLLYWAIVVSLKAFGLTTAAVRLPIALATFASVALTFLIGDRLGGPWRGFLAGLIHLCCCGVFLRPHRHAGAGLQRLYRGRALLCDPRLRTAAGPARLVHWFLDLRRRSLA